MAKDCRYLLDTLLYNPELYPGKCRVAHTQFSVNKKLSQTDACLSGPPFFVPDAQVQSLFGECFRTIVGSARFPFLKHATMNLQFFLTVLLRFLREELRYRTAAVGGRDGGHVARLGAGLHD